MTDRAVLISVRPKYCELIANGEKTIEVRKTRPKMPTPFKCYIYCTKPEIITKYVFKPEDYPEYMRPGKTVFCKAPDAGSPFCSPVNGNSKVIGEFVCDFIANYEAELWDDETFECIKEFYEPDDFAEYGEYIYNTIADNGDDFWKKNMLCKASCLTVEELREYLGTGFTNFYGWHISNLVIYDEPKALSEFYNYDTTYNNAFGWAFSKEEKRIYLKRPPQSWRYVQEVTDNG